MKYRLIIEFEASDDPSARNIGNEIISCIEADLPSDNVKLQRIKNGESPVGLKF